MATVRPITPSFRQTPNLDHCVSLASVHLSHFFMTAFPDNEPATPEAKDRHEKGLSLFGESLVRMVEEQECVLPLRPIEPGDLQMACMKLSRNCLEQLFINMRGAGGIYGSNAASDRSDVRNFVLENAAPLLKQGMAALADSRQVTNIRFLLGQNRHHDDFQIWIKDYLDLPDEADLTDRINRRLIAAQMKPYKVFESGEMASSPISGAQILVFGQH